MDLMGATFDALRLRLRPPVWPLAINSGELKMGGRAAPPSESRHIQFSADCCKIPERLLLAHSRGEVLFIAGAGASMSAGLPDFRGLTLDVYKKFDPVLYVALAAVPGGVCNQWAISPGSLQPHQLAEARRFIQGDYDVALGMLERRIDGVGNPTSRIRDEIASILSKRATKHAPIHKSLMRLADRGGVVSIATTNFDHMLEQASRSIGSRARSYSLGAIPRPGKSHEFSGVMHIHGRLPLGASADYFVVSDRDFGEYYLRRQVVTDFIYDAARLFNLVLVGYSANDPPMRYLLNAVAADGTRFTDLKDRYAFVGGSDVPDAIQMNDWGSRGITPIHYDASHGHVQLTNTLRAWALYSSHSGSERDLKRAIGGIVKAPRSSVSDAQRDLFDHFYRRGSSSERRALVKLVSGLRGDPSWLSAFVQIGKEARHS